MILKDKVALVTGAGAGIGRAIAVTFGREGARIVVTDRSVEFGQETMDLLSRDGVEATFVHLNVTDPIAHQAAVAVAEERFGRLDLACNNAGISVGSSTGAYPPLADVTLVDWAATIDVNLTGVFYGLRAQIPAIARAGGGAIVNMASVMGQVAAAGLGAYVASKHGVVGLTKAAALDYAAQHVRINAIGPGYINTLMLAGKDAATRARLGALHPLGRLGLAEEIAELAVWLCSERASFVTGSYYPADGGYLAQ